MKANVFTALFVAVLITCNFSAYAIDTYDPATKILNMDAVRVGGMEYGRVSVEVPVSDVKGVDGGIAASVDSFDTATSVLTLGSVAVTGGNTYTNVRVGIGSYNIRSIGISCTLPAYVAPTGNACITPMGSQYQKAAPANELAASVAKVTDAAFLQATASGDVLLMETGNTATVSQVVADRTRTLVYAVYRQNGGYYIKPLFKDTLTSPLYEDRLPYGVLTGFMFDRVQGDVAGLLFRQIPSLRCYLSYTDEVNRGFGNKESSLCSWKI